MYTTLGPGLLGSRDVSTVLACVLAALLALAQTSGG